MCFVMFFYDRWHLNKHIIIIIIIIIINSFSRV